jgi:predicted ATPase
MKLKSLEIKGFKSISPEGQRIPLGDVTVLLGANGSGKSNLLSFFRLLNALATDKLYYHTKYYGGANRLLYLGGKAAQSMSFSLSLENENSSGTYQATLSPDANDSLFLNNAARPSQEISDFLAKIQVYQFHDTTDTSPLKRQCHMDDVYFLRSDGGNIAPFLKMLKNSFPRHYAKIVRHIQNVFPQFGDFLLDPFPGTEYVQLNWKSKSENGYVFFPSQLSDGTLRFIALATLLLLPAEILPPVLVIDEPELGLHPAALSELVAMVRYASQNSQVLLATQSSRLVDEFLPEQIVVVERDEARECSVYTKPDAALLQEWLERYTLSELWEKNVLGGNP